ncbi:MAG: hypothetical protein HZA89_13845 [Verrucomicrobia bacterium]|nr:hypothetical protein [Verrucomicrobiota bacterium]
MDTNAAAENLQVIRTLMERSALYRRALAPVMTFAGATGLVAAALGWLLKIGQPRAFTLYWLAVSVVALAGVFLISRQQALKDKEPFWSPPARRVTQAILPPLFLGLMAALMLGLPSGNSPVPAWWLPPGWMALYGCALHAAGFFTARGMRWLGWAFILAGSACFFALGQLSIAPSPFQAHALMGGAFGGLHLAAGLYLYATERNGKTA